MDDIILMLVNVITTNNKRHKNKHFYFYLNIYNLY